MTDIDSSILYGNFHGIWDVTTQAHPQESKSARVRRVVIQHKEDLRYTLSWWMKDELSRPPDGSTEVFFNIETGTLMDKERTVNVSFWRNPVTDVIFAFQKKEKKEEEVAWVAQRAPQEITVLRPREEALCRRWKIILRQGSNAAEGFVELQVLEADRLNVGLLGLFHVKDGKRDLYDILAWNEGVRSFNSAFRVRSLNFWPGIPSDPRDDRIFATFDSRFALPRKHFGHGLRALGGLMPHEQRLGDSDDDPDTGVWVGEPA